MIESSFADRFFLHLAFKVDAFLKTKNTLVLKCGEENYLSSFLRLSRFTIMARAEFDVFLYKQRSAMITIIKTVNLNSVEQETWRARRRIVAKWCDGRSYQYHSCKNGNLRKYSYFEGIRRFHQKNKLLRI